MRKYRHLPTIVEAVQFDPKGKWPECVIPWPPIDDNRDDESNHRDKSFGYIRHENGPQHVEKGDWIIKGPGGYFRHRDEVFRANYESVQGATMNTDEVARRGQPLTFIPPAMHPWGLQIITPEPSEFGAFHLVGCEQADIELHHQVEVVDEDNRPLRGIVVIFGFDSGPSINMPPRVNHWRDAPAVLRGNAQTTNAMGYVQHTLGEGGENIWVWHRDENGDLLYPSAIVKNCTWVGPPVGRFIHTGVKLTFALRRTGVTPAADRLAALEAWVTQFDERLKAVEGK